MGCPADGALEVGTLETGFWEEVEFQRPRDCLGLGLLGVGHLKGLVPAAPLSPSPCTDGGKLEQGLHDQSHHDDWHVPLGFQHLVLPKRK